MAIKIQVKNNNGKLQIEQEKNGEKTRITESEDGIEVEKKDAKGNATKKTYKNVEDLKQKDKSAHELFQKHKKMGAGFRIQMNGNGNLMPFKAQPFKIPNARPKNPEQNKEKSGAEDNLQKFHEQTLKRHRDMMEMQLRTLEKIKENAPEQQRKQLDELFKRQSDLMNQQLRVLERNLKPEKKSEPGSKPQPPAEAETPATQESGEKKPATAPSTQPGWEADARVADLLAAAPHAVVLEVLLVGELFEGGLALPLPLLPGRVDRGVGDGRREAARRRSAEGVVRRPARVGQRRCSAGYDRCGCEPRHDGAPRRRVKRAAAAGEQNCCQHGAAMPCATGANSLPPPSAARAAAGLREQH